MLSLSSPIGKITRKDLTYFLDLPDTWACFVTQLSGSFHWCLKKWRMIFLLFQEKFDLDLHDPWIQGSLLTNPKVSILQATQCSDTIWSIPALRKMARYLCIVQIPGLIICTHSLRWNLTTKYHFITRMIHNYKVFDYNLHSSRLGQRITAEN